MKLKKRVPMQSISLYIYICLHNFRKIFRRQKFRFRPFGYLFQYSSLSQPNAQRHRCQNACFRRGPWGSVHGDSIRRLFRFQISDLTAVFAGVDQKLHRFRFGTISVNNFFQIESV